MNTLLLCASFFATAIASSAASPPLFVDQSEPTFEENTARPFSQGLDGLSKQELAYVRADSQHGPVRFDGDSVLRVRINGNADRLVLEQDILGNPAWSLDLWTELPKSDASGSIDIRVSAEDRNEVTHLLRAHEIQYAVQIENVQDLVDREKLALQLHSVLWEDAKGYREEWLSLPVDEDPFFKAYPTHERVLSFMEIVHQKFPELSELVQVGTTYEGRAIQGLRIHSRKSGAAKKSIVYHGGQHAREWISVAVNCFFIRQFVTQYGKSASITKLLDTFEYTIVPIMNVDGYLYSHEKNRMWRKNRQPTARSFCVGTDTNRNWNSSWGTAGASASPCSDAFHGVAPFSSPEPLAVSMYIQERGNVINYIDFHAYSQLWMTPFGYSCEDVPADDAALQTSGKVAAAALQKVNGKRFKVGGVCNIIYQASGGSLDWAYIQGKVKYSFGVELRDTGTYGFLLPPDQILPSGHETLAAIEALGEFIIQEEGL